LCLSLESLIDVSKYEKHIEDIKFVNEMCGLNDEILVCGDFNLWEVSWVYDEEEICMLPFDVTKEKFITLLDGMAINNS
jgi:hypothetical protein